MKTITKYEAVDGTEFDTEKECATYEKLIARVNSIMAELPSKPNDDGCHFSNGGGYIQHDKNVLQSVKMKLLTEIKKHIDHKWVDETMKDDSVDLSYVDRLLDDYQIEPLRNAWYRIMCIDKEAREWGQVYFAYNPEKGQQVKLN
jgi:hypothetical protein